MDTENALTNAKESPNEIFFEEEARSMGRGVWQAI